MLVGDHNLLIVHNTPVKGLSHLKAFNKVAAESTDCPYIHPAVLTVCSIYTVLLRKHKMHLLYYKQFFSGATRSDASLCVYDLQTLFVFARRVRTFVNVV